MSESRVFTYWVVDCKTQGCGSLIVGVAGPLVRHKFFFIPPCLDFEATCSGCMKTYVYSRSDLRSDDIQREPTPADRNSAFLAAVERASLGAKEHSDESVNL